MKYAENYRTFDPDVPTFRGKMPFALYVELQNHCPQLDGESDLNWVRRIQAGDLWARTIFKTPEFKTELMQAVQRRALAQAGGRRKGHTTPFPYLAPSRSYAPHPDLKDPPKDTVAVQYAEDYLMHGGQYKYAREAYDQLVAQFDGATPVDGSIFWSGVNYAALAKLVDKWNRQYPDDELFGQLEATTSFRYVNGAFEYIRGDVVVEYTRKSSELLAKGAKGHVTAVAQFGMRPGSVFNDTELPSILGMMNDALLAGREPAVTDITIVLVEPKHMPDTGVHIFTNNELATIPLVRAADNRSIKSRAACNIEGLVTLPPAVRDYWTKKRTVPASITARLIALNIQEVMK